MTRESLIIACGLMFASCASSIHHAPIRATAAELHLHDKMSDPQILRALGFDPSRMKARKGSGVCGPYADYKTTDGQWVGITRSASTGTSIMVWDRYGQQGDWYLGFK